MMDAKRNGREPQEALAELWSLGGGAAAALDRVDFTGAGPVLPSSFCVATAAQVSIAAAGLAAAEIHGLRNGQLQRVRVDKLHAATEFLSERYLRIDGETPELWDKLAGVYRCGDGRWVRIHTNFAHHRDRILDILGCAAEREALVHAFANWSALEFEECAAQSGAIAAMMRTELEWREHPHGQALKTVPILTIERIGDAPVEPLPEHSRPLGGVRVLDLTRIIAGPVAGRTLAAHGADVLVLTAAHLPSVLPLVVDSGRGKLSCEVDLRRSSGLKSLEALLIDSDVFVQGYRPGAIAERGCSPERAAQLRPGIVYVSLSAYGDVGPWCKRRGFDSIVQTACGFNAEEAAAAGLDNPQALPCQALDHASGYLLAFGAMMALRRRMTEGGSWHVRVSLARTGEWIRDFGRVTDGLRQEPPSAAMVQDFLQTTASGFGQLTSVRHAAELSGTPAVWTRPSVPLGTHPPAWPARQAS